MVQEVRQNEPRYSCRVSVESFTGNPDEEVIAFGSSAEEALLQAEQVLAMNYEISAAEVIDLMQQAIVESLAPWCAPNLPHSQT